MNNLLRFFGRHAPDIDALSAYLDARLPEPEAERLAAHLASCAACRTRLDGLAAARAALRAVPEADAPRSFRLPAGEARRAAAPSAASRVSPLIRWAPAISAAAAVVFAIVVAIDVTSSGGGSSATRAPFTASRASQESTAADTSAGAASAPAPQTGAPAATQPTPGAGVAGLDTSTAATEPAAGSATPEAPRELAPATTTAPNSYAATATAQSGALSTTRDAARTPAGTGDGNKATALRVIEIIAAALAVVSAAVVVRWWRAGRERTP